MAETVLGVIGEVVVGKIVDYLVAPITRQLTYMCCFNGNIKKLDTQLKKLKTTREDVETGVENDRRKVRKIGRSVQEWLQDANKVTSEADGIIQDKSKVKEGCLNVWWFPNLKLRYSLSRKAVKTTKDVVELNAAGDKHTREYYGRRPVCLNIIHNPDFSGFESRKLNLVDIFKALTGDEFKLIGICGQGGVGKTTMVREARKRAIEEKLFDEVGFVVVGQNPDLTNVQKHIADNFDLAEEMRKLDDQGARASLLFERLSQDEKKILLILDDIWEGFNLEEHGIPFRGSRENFKILYTSRSQDLWRDVPTKKIALELLSNEEAWQLFRDKAGVLVPELQPIAEQIVNECGRLPLALVIIGSTLSKKSKDIWEDMLDRLKSSSSSTFVYNSLYSKLELSYNYLEEVEAKRLFLLCCLFEENKSIRIEDLARYGLGLSFFDGVNGIISKARHRVSALVYDLKSCYLLLEGEDDEHVKVHDVVRDMGIHIASRDKEALVSHGDVSEWPKKDTYEHYTSISVISQKITELPEGLTCPKLEFLFLKCREVEKLSCNFFERMEKLKVLKLHKFHGILTLQSWKNLQTLSLEGYRGDVLDNVSVIRELRHLEILSFRYSRIKELPEEIGELVKLRLLDLSYTGSLNRIPAGVIHSLSHLEELYMVGSSFGDWEGEGEEEAERNANLSEFLSLSNLNTLEIRIRADVHIPKRPIFSTLQRYNVNICTRDNRWFSGSNPYKKELLVKSSLTPIPSDVGEIDSLLRSADSLILKGKGCNDLVGMLFRDFWVDALQQLKNLSISECDTPEFLANTMNPVEQPTSTAATVFPILEKLNFDNLPYLREIWRGPVRAGSFGKLTSIDVSDCGRLRNLFQLPIVGCLSPLKGPSIDSRDVIEEDISKEQREDVLSVATCRIEFPKLESLKLNNLPKLRGFSDGIDEIDFSQLEELLLSKLPKINLLFHENNNMSSNLEQHNNVGFCSLFPRKVTFPSLEDLRLENLPNVSHIWSNELPIMSSFAKLKKLNVYGCGSLSNMFHPSMARVLVNLQELSIWNCSKMEAVVGLEEEVEGKGSKIVKTLFPQLRELGLINLPNLRRFCHFTHSLELPLLTKMHIWNCPNMDAFSVGHVSTPKLSLPGVSCTGGLNTDVQFLQEVKFPSLEELKLVKLPNVSHIWSNELPILSSFAKLKKFYVDDCGNLSNIFHPSMAGILVNLQDLHIENCSKMEAVVGLEEGQGSKIVKTLFPLLRVLHLYRLPNLKRFCHFTHSLELALLTRIEIRDCPHMEAFSVGHVSAPKLPLADVSWTGDLNNDLQLLREELRKKEEVKKMIALRMEESRKTEEVEKKKKTALIMEEEDRKMEQEERRKEESAKRMTTT